MRFLGNGFLPQVRGGGGGTMLLDGVANVVAAYGLRQLMASYTGAAVRVIRTSDSAEMDIGFVNGEFDESTFSSFIGGGGSIKTVYDQTGNAHHLQSTAGSRPTLGLNSINGKPAILFLDSFLEATVTLPMTALSVFFTGGESVAVNNAGFIALHSGSGNDYDNANASIIESDSDGNSAYIQYIHNGDAAIAQSGAKPTPIAVYSLTNNEYTAFRSNGSTIGTIYDSYGGTSSSLLVGGRYLGGISASYRLNGAIAEMVFLSPAAVASVENQIGSGMAARFGYSWTNI